MDDIVEDAINEVCLPDGTVSGDPEARRRALRLIHDLCDERLIRQAHGMVASINPAAAKVLGYQT